MALSVQRSNKENEEGELRPLFERPAISQVNPVDQKWFAQLGRCQGFEARPAVMHFDGFQTGQIHTQYLKILNISKSAKRMHIINPTTKEFTVRVEKRGILAPGMAETIAIDFEPTEWRYHYDCIRIYTEADNLLVPIHGYPVVNVVNFPKQIDFGECALKEGKRKVVSLSCKVPIQFEYKIELSSHNPDFTVSPLNGLIPANGVAEIAIEFIPLNFGTFHLEFVLHVSQFNFKPITCTVTASCVPGLVRDQALSLKASQLLMTKGSNLTLGSDPTSMLSPNTFGFKLGDSGRMEGGGAGGAGETSPLSTLLHDATVDLMDTNLPISNLMAPKGVGSGAVLDGGADLISKSAVDSSYRRHKKPKPYIPPEKMVEGLLVPNDLSTTQSINYILTQKAGKLKPKALQGAIRHQKAIRAEQLQQQAAIRSAVGGGGGGLSVHAIKAEEGSVSTAAGYGLDSESEKKVKQPRQAREMAFLQDLNEVDRSEKAREFKSSQEAIGSKMLTPEEIDVIIAQREHVSTYVSFMKRSSERALIKTVFKGPNEKPGPLLARPETLAHAKPDYVKAQFDVNGQDVWSKRRKTLQRCIYLVGKWITRSRADKRLKAIKARLNGCTSREAVRALVELDNQQAGSGEGVAPAGGGGGNSNPSSGGTSASMPTLDTSYMSSPAAQLLADMGFEQTELNNLRFEIGSDDNAVQPTLFPCFEEDSGTVRNPVDSGWTSSLGFHDMSYLEARAPREADLMGYEVHASPPVDTFAPCRDRQGIRMGATEESGVRAPRGEGGTLCLPKVPLKDKQGISTPNESDNNTASQEESEVKSNAPPLPPPPPSNVTDIMEVLFVKQASKEYDSKALQEMFTPLDPVIFGPEKLRPSKEYKVMSRFTVPLETDANWNLRPQLVEYDIPTDYACRLANSVGSSTLHAFRHVSTQSSHGWRQRRDKRASTLLCLPDQHLQTLWNHQRGGLPQVIRSPDKSDTMSDSESEDEGEGDHVTIPTAELAKGYFDPDLDGTLNHDSMMLMDEMSSSFSNASTNKLDRLIMRDMMMLQLQSQNLQEREEAVLELPNRMEAIGSEVVNLSNKFLLQKPYHVIKVVNIKTKN